MGDFHYTTPTFDFKFDFEIPSPRNWRIITERDELGRIIISIVPPVSHEWCDILQDSCASVLF